MKTSPAAVIATIVTFFVGFISGSDALAQGGTWTTKAPMPTTSNALAAASINGIVYAVGGGNASDCTPSSILYAYDPASDTWATKAPMPTPRYSLAVVAVNQTLYAIGGGGYCSDGGDRATVEAYDSVTDTWTTKASLPVASRDVSASVINGIVYVVSNESYPSTLYAYDPATDTWTTKAIGMTPSRSYGATSAVNGIMYWTGGTDGAVDAYNPVTDSWTRKASSIPNTRGNLGAGVINGKIYFVGGEGVTAETDAYDPATDTWTIQAPMPTPRGQIGVAVVNGVLYALGGHTSSFAAILATNEAFTPAVTSPVITSPRNNAIPYSQFVALTGTGEVGSSLNVILNRTPVGSVVVDSEGHWEALVYLRALATGTTSAVDVCDQRTGLCSNRLIINDRLAFRGADAPPGGFISVANRCLSLRRADILVTGDPTSLQEPLYGPNYTHTALYLGGDANGTPFVAEAVTKSEAGKLGQVRSVRLEDSLVWLQARVAGFRPTDSLALSGSTRDAIVSKASAFTSERPPASYWDLSIFKILLGPHKLLHLLLKLEQALHDLKPSTTEFICSTLVWHAYFDGTNQTLDISTPNNMTAQPGSMFDGLPPLIIDDLRPYLPVPETFATSPKLKQIF